MAGDFVKKLITHLKERPEDRYGVTSIISFGLAFLIPYLGWTPLLLLWTGNAVLSYHENKGRRMRYLHAVAALLFGVMALVSIVQLISLLIQAF